jgi:hypothetical protein
MRHRALVVTVAVSIVLSAVSLGLFAWVLVDPSYWLPGAYSTNKGPQGDVGPRGPVGPAGPEGPVGPDAQTAIDDLSSTVDDLSSRVDDLETGTGDQASMSLDDVATAVSDICSAVSSNDVYDTSTAFGSFISDVAVACP